MAVTSTQVFPQTPRAEVIQATVANTNRDGSTGTYSSSFAAGPNGTVIDYITFTAIAATAAGVLRIFLSANNSTNWRLIDEVIALGVTPSGVLPAERLIWTPQQGGLTIPASSGLRFNVNNSETWNILPAGGDL